MAQVAALPRVVVKSRRYRLGLGAVLLVRAPELVRQGWRQLSTYRLRTGLALLGIIVGVTSVVGSVALLGGIEAMIRTSYEVFMGGDRAGILRGLTELSVAGRVTPLPKIFTVTEEDRQALTSAIPEIEAITPATLDFQRVVSSRTEIDGLRVQGVGPGFFAIRRVPLGDGRWFRDADYATAARVALMSRALATELFGDGPVLGEEIRIRGQRFAVVGTLNPLGPGMNRWLRQVIVPYETAMARLGSDPMRTSTWVKFRPGHRFDSYRETMLELLSARHRGATDKNFRVFGFGRFQDRVLNDLQAQGRILMAVAGLCLVAGAVGILNVLLISVTERTREIGLRLALGATRRGVLGQFLFEAILLCLTGGIIGIGGAWAFAGLLAARVRERFVDGLIDPTILDVTPPAGAILLGLGLAVVTGITAGVYPAWRAARVDPAESLRRE